MVSTQTAMIVGVAALLIAGCTTTGQFVIPEGTQLEVHRRPVSVGPDGKVTTQPFFWTAVGIPESGGGIEYRLFRDGEVIQQGRLRTKFRVASIFWPPIFHGVIYWPLGFNPNITYDLVRGTQE